ncbi:MAG: phosphoglycerate mutase family protein [Anaerolineales bacterium]|nr:phosphoglycerate mutase family protein [Anaerolineales bacterium]
MSKLLLIKHAMPELDPTVPAPEWHLGERGRARCESLANKLTAYALNVIVSSVEPKAIETAQIVATRLSKPHEIAEGLHEHDRRNVPFMPLAELEARAAEFFAKPDELVLGSETGNQAHARFANAIDRVIEKHPQKNIAIVSHGSVISLFIARNNEMPFDFWKRLGLPSIVVLSLPGFQIEEVIENVE